MRIRHAEPGDVDALARIWVDGWHEAHAELLPPELVRFRTYDHLRSRLLANLDNTSVVSSQGHLVGFALVKKDELDQLYVARGARGKGIAASLLSHALGRIGRAGHRRAWLACAIGNDRAARFYEKSGWSRQGVVTIKLDTPDGVVLLDIWRYEITI